MTSPTRYRFPDGALLYCRACRDLQPHKTESVIHVACKTCGKRIHMAEVVATYSADEYQNPAPILLPWRLLPSREQARRMTLATNQSISTGAYRLKPVDRATLRGEVDLMEIEAMP